MSSEISISFNFEAEARGSQLTKLIDVFLKLEFFVVVGWEGRATVESTDSAYPFYSLVGDLTPD